MPATSVCIDGLAVNISQGPGAREGLEGPALLGERSDEAPCLLSWGEW